MSVRINYYVNVLSGFLILDRTLSLLASLSRWYNNEKVILLDNLTFYPGERSAENETCEGVGSEGNHDLGDSVGRADRFIRC